MDTPAPLTLKQVVEALVFASPKPITTKEIVAALRSAGEGSEIPEVVELAKAKEANVIDALNEAQAEMIATGRAFGLVEKVNGWTLASEPACALWVRQLYPEAKPTRLSGPQLETLAIIAYRQPVTRADIEAVRGVSVDGVMQVLLDRGLVKIAGRAEIPGRPLLYSTTTYFLDHFGLKTTDDLPNAGELKRVVLPTAKVEEPKAEKPEKAEKPPKEGAAAPAAAAAATATETTATEATAENAPASESAPVSESDAADATSPAEETVAADEAQAPLEEVIPEPAEEPAPISEPEPEPESEPEPEPEPTIEEAIPAEEPVAEEPISEETPSADEPPAEPAP